VEVLREGKDISLIATGHIYNVVSPEEEDVIRETDRQIARYVDELDRTVGRMNYLIVVTADHGQQPLPETVGGWRIDSHELGLDVEARFGDIVDSNELIQIWERAPSLATTKGVGP
jgi:predicted RNA-binding protein with PIN domain